MLDTIKSFWDKILTTARDEKDLTNVSFKTWLLPLEPVSFNQGVLTIYYSGAGGQQARAFIENRYSFLIQYAIEEVTGIQCTLKFTSSKEESLSKEAAAPVTTLFSTANLNPRYTFDSFVVGNSNMLAHSAALAVAEAPGESYNPLYIYGGVGLGKTHLMQSIAHFVLQQNPNARVLYVSCENFMNEMIDSIRSNTQADFRNKYRYVDVLLIDDIQFIAKKAGTQEEFFHTFSALYEAKKQIVITSDRPPKEIDDLDERLRSRFSAGFPVDIGLPDYETRMAILRKKEELEGYNVDSEVMKYIASNIKSNIRELEGALIKIVATSRLMKQPVTLPMAEAALRDLISENTVREITLPYILEVVSEHFKVSKEDIISKKKDAGIVFPRHIVMYLSRVMTDFPLTVIGQFLGGRDHSTVIHGIDNIKEQMKNDQSLCATIDILTKKIKP